MIIQETGLAIAIEIRIHFKYSKDNRNRIFISEKFPCHGFADHTGMGVPEHGVGISLYQGDGKDVENGTVAPVVTCTFQVPDIKGIVRRDVLRS